MSMCSLPVRGGRLFSKRDKKTFFGGEFVIQLVKTTDDSQWHRDLLQKQSFMLTWPCCRSGFHVLCSSASTRILTKLRSHHPNSCSHTIYTLSKFAQLWLCTRYKYFPCEAQTPCTLLLGHPPEDLTKELLISTVF